MNLKFENTFGVVPVAGSDVRVPPMQVCKFGVSLFDRRSSLLVLMASETLISSKRINAPVSETAR